ncbi:glycosyltransferase [Carboxylicivirga sp. N1Y90]|uniref:glycosyltransferase n=1 Tax=Carboxylicivirga fragile TaxID=3417571 RepID=UPI003D32A0A0|nr:glycosyltransferase [Marinilabiliaceae bacterium N1Y90]
MKSEFNMQEPNIIISPSGSFYGSERVLLDYLSKTSNSFIVFVPANSIFEEKLLKLSTEADGKFKVKSFKKIYLLYISIAFMLLKGSIKKVYANEGGHIKFLHLLAKIFPKIKFYSHLRIKEDTDHKRYSKPLPNLLLISVSEFISGFIKPELKAKTITLYDPYQFRSDTRLDIKEKKKYSIAIIGRIAPVKGLTNIENYFKSIQHAIVPNISFNFYGQTNNDPISKKFVEEIKKIKSLNIKFWNHIDDISDIYDNSDIIMHFNENEPVGRIFFEAIDYLKPFIGFNSGGIGEIANNIKYKNIVTYDTQGNWIENINNLLQDIINNYLVYQKQMLGYKKNAQKIYALNLYTQQLDKLLD